MVLRRVAVYPSGTERVGGTGRSWCPLGGAVVSFRLVSGSSGLMSSRDKAYIKVGDSG
jgi:hypothetical protein